MQKQTILFDLDGTLTDSKLGITKAISHALLASGIQVDDLDSLRPLIGPPLHESFKKFYGFNEEQVMAAMDKYREYYNDTGIFENMLFSGIAELLQTLTAEGKQIAMATSKPTVYAVRIARHFGIAQYFKCIMGSELDGTRIRKGEVITAALQELKVQDLSAVVMIGDREQDVIGARENGIDSISVLYGYGDRAELTRAGATVLAASVAELGQLLTYGQGHGGQVLLSE